MVLGTVVDVRGSAYRMPGARILIGRDGQRTGMISGGCLEKDVVRQAFAWTERGPTVVEYDTRSDELHPQGRYGTGCDGVVHLLLERVGSAGGRGAIDPLLVLADVHERRRRVVMATFYDGPSELIGRRILWREGIVESDSVDSDLVDVLTPLLQEATRWSRPRSVRVVGATALVEALKPPLDFVIFGAGDDAVVLAEMAATLGWRVRVADKWPALVTRERFPTADALVCAPGRKAADSLAIGADSVVVLATHSLDDDAVLLPEVLATGAHVVLVGPRSRTARLMRALAADGRLPPVDQLDRLETPAGLDLGGEGPEEVAASIVAGVIASRNGRAGGFLAGSAVSIHDEHVRMEIE